MALLEVGDGNGCKNSICGSEPGWKQNDAAQSRLDTRMAGTY